MEATRSISRRAALKGSAGAVLGSTFTIMRPELVRGAGKERLKAGLVGCGGRGTQAVENLLTADPNVEIVAMADVFEDHLEKAFRTLGGDPRNAALRDRVRVDAEHKFTGFDAYRKVLASDIDVVMLCTPPAYARCTSKPRWRPASTSSPRSRLEWIPLECGGSWRREEVEGTKADGDVRRA